MNKNSGNITKGNFKKVAPKHKTKRTGTILLCVVTIIIAVFLSPLFNINEIFVRGITNLSEEYVINSSGIIKGEHALRANIKDAKKRLEKSAYISSAKISYIFPGKILITVNEKMPVVYYEFADGYVGINSDGYVTDIVQNTDIPLPIANGIKLSSYMVGQKPVLKDTKEAQINCLTAVASEIANIGLCAEIKTIDVSKITDITLKTKDGITVKCGDSSELNYKLSVLKEIIPNADCNGIIDISTPGHATYEMM